MANGIAFKIQGLKFSSFKCMPRSEIAGPHDKFVFNSLRKWQPPPAVLAFYVQACRVWGLPALLHLHQCLSFPHCLMEAILVPSAHGKAFHWVSLCTPRKTNSSETIFRCFLKSSVSLADTCPTPRGFHSYTGHGCGWWRPEDPARLEEGAVFLLDGDTASCKLPGPFPLGFSWFPRGLCEVLLHPKENHTESIDLESSTQGLLSVLLGESTPVVLNLPKAGTAQYISPCCGDLKIIFAAAS